MTTWEVGQRITHPLLGEFTVSWINEDTGFVGLDNSGWCWVGPTEMAKQVFNCSHEVHPKETQLNVELLQSTVGGEWLTGAAAHLCYSDETIDEVYGSSHIDTLQRVMTSGHHSVIEHAYYSFGIEGISRACLAQLTRHRIASFSVQSQRYVSAKKGFQYIVPPQFREDPAVEAEFHRCMETCQESYNKLLGMLKTKGELANQDARFVLPNAAATTLVLSMNARELRHFFRLRLCERAQWELRALAERMWELVAATAPTIFAKSGPACVSGACPEGSKCCGKQEEMRLRYTLDFMR